VTTNERRIKYLTFIQIEKLFRVITSPRDRAIFQVGFYRGLRASEVAKLQLSDYRPDAGRLYVTRCKGSVSNEYPLFKAETHALRAWLKVRGNAPGPLFPSRLGRGISQQQLDKLMKSYCRRAALPPDRAHFHALRHSCAMWLVENDRDLLEVQDHLGHAAISSTVIYARVSGRKRERLVAAIESAPRR
jgi:integrase/recombinase XerD